MLLGQELKFKNKLCNLKLGTFFSALPGLGASALSGRVELTCETRIIMTQDTSIYYVWIGGSCDYGLGERGIRDSVLWRKQSRIIMMKLNNTKSEWLM